MAGLAFDPQVYGPAVTELLKPERLPELGPGRPNEAAREQLRRLTPESLLTPGCVTDRTSALACMAGLWLLHDFLDESHRISQEIETVDGSYWHGIMHRREPDFSNAKYWFRRVGDHPTGRALLAAARELAAGESDTRDLSFLEHQSNWDHFRFVDLCEAAQHGKKLQGVCRKIQLVEWQLLFEHCFRHAVG